MQYLPAITGSSISSHVLSSDHGQQQQHSCTFQQPCQSRAAKAPGDTTTESTSMSYSQEAAP
eukprot:scaffold188_cov336-Pavlova_lutheri.AAC.7